MLSCTRRELIATFLGVGAPLTAAALSQCGVTSAGSVARPSQFDGALLGQNVELGHRLRDGRVPPPSHTRSVPIVIVGAGIAGLSAAWRLARARQLDYEVLELEPAPGGTARSGKNSVSAFPLGAHYLPCPLPHARAVRTLLCEMGIAEERSDGDLDYDETQLVRAPQERVFIADRWYEGEYPHAGATREDQAQLARFERELAHLGTLRDARGRPAFAVPLAYSGDAPELHALDRVSFAAWLDERGLTSHRLRWWLEYGTRDDMGATLQQTSAFAGLHYHAARLTPSGPSPFLTWPEGNGRLVAHLAQVAGPRLHTDQALTRVRRLPDQRYELHVLSPATNRCEALIAEHVVFAVPAAVTARVLEQPQPALLEAAHTFRSGAWLVANLTLHRQPSSRGFPLCWDNVLYGSRSVGYVVNTHQTDAPDRARSVWTWYLPLTSDDPGEDRRRLLGLSFQECAELAVADLARAHRDIAQCIERIDVFRWGHAMVRPTPGLYTGSLAHLRHAAQQPDGGLHFAHSELSGLALFEEAQWHGVRAAEEILAARGIHTDSLS